MLAVTFTNKAAREMHDRVGAILGRPVSGCGSARSACRARECCGGTRALWPCQEILRFSIPMIQVRLLKQVMEAARVDTKRRVPPALTAPA
jgi:DNA helicase-2/ATP-dependent DNA helicase PcrA